MNKKRPCMLMILDGWGLSPSTEGNACYIAETPFLDRLFKEYPNTSLLCSGKAVGLPEGIMGNSEVGHLNIGAGRIVYQNLLRIDKAIEDRSFFENEVLSKAMAGVKAGHSTLHLMGLVSDAGVHSQLRHLFALLEMAKEKGLNQVVVHAILDGRDTPPDSGIGFVKTLQEYIAVNGLGRIATICGRYYAMDRDTRWDRSRIAYQLYTQGDGEKETDPVEAVKNAYNRGETDEFVKPISLTDNDGNPVSTVNDGDGVIFFNFRADRARQITRIFTDTGFDEFERDSFPELSEFVCMTLYDKALTLPVAYPPVHMKEILGEVISREGLNQLRIAETEKYAHVTYFFNGGEEHPFKNEDRCLIPSPREVATYDLKPEMSAPEVAKEVVSRIKSDKYDLIVINFANLDMVGHTGILDAAIKACETIDRCVEKVVTAVKEQGGVVLLTADHGNSEKMKDENGKPHTAHTLNPVPVILIDDTMKQVKLINGSLCDLVPTVLQLMGIAQPEQMTGRSLIQ